MGRWFLSVDPELLAEKTLTANEKLGYRYCELRGALFKGPAVMARELGVGLRTVKRLQRDLERKGLVFWDDRGSGGRSQYTKIAKVVPFNEWKTNRAKLAQFPDHPQAVSESVPEPCQVGIVSETETVPSCPQNRANLARARESKAKEESYSEEKTLEALCASEEKTLEASCAIVFARLWGWYPETHRGDREVAIRAWNTALSVVPAAGRKNLAEAIIAGMKLWLTSGDWIDSGGAFIPWLGAFIKGEKWRKAPLRPGTALEDYRCCTCRGKPDGFRWSPEYGLYGWCATCFPAYKAAIG